ncbi:HAD-like protein [Cylindrobasidium torrendii FP15055 ss-10]|uniref:HAD-like protein n=1 Tax=Cylindrobasidium torrendii FP15055 ss-10 TaxID=1314674 RepID=A0A0D7BUZ1_9AGAR|nr:HAD-like protein [Cylindrobasidium torrendii FP15055 ss-10]
MPSTTIHADAVLFDMDGTLVDSTSGLEGAWNLFKKTYPQLDIRAILGSSHGVRAVENIRNYCGITDIDELEREAERFDSAIVPCASEDGRPGIVLLPGVAAAFEAIGAYRFLPNPLWAICTSGSKAYANSATASAGVPVPDVFVTSEDVEQGKPAPDPYILGAKRSGVKTENCVVVEDAPNGVISGNAAGCKTIGLLTTHNKEQMEAAHPHFLVPDMSFVKFSLATAGGLDITITTAD